MTPLACDYKETLLKVSGVSLTLGGVPILRDVNLEIKDLHREGYTQGQVVGLLGPSGIGKTTAVTRALEELGHAEKVMRLSARRLNDIDMVRALPAMKLTSPSSLLICEFVEGPAGPLVSRGEHSHAPDPPVRAPGRRALPAGQDHPVRLLCLRHAT